ncbi:MAG: chromosomal replication initiator protein DnaA [Patescibacteria group bacterium]
MDKDKLWQTVLGEIEVGMSSANFQTWFKGTSLEDVRVDEGVVVIRVPNNFTQSWLQNKFQKELHGYLNKHIGKVMVVQYVIGARKLAAVGATKSPKIEEQLIPEALAPTQEESKREGLNPKLIFENFVVGENSRMCYAAAESVASQPGVGYNPLFIYGDAGLGKTHLLQAIGNQILTNNPRAKVVYITSEKFINEMVDAIRHQKTGEFKNKYRKVDCLLVDDIQFLSAKEQTQEEFFHTFNALHSDGKQIVLTSDRPPKAIPALEDRLRSRFEWGLIADISIPSYETRLAILRSKLSLNNKELPDDVLEYIAKTVKNNVRELEGAMTRILAYGDLNATSPTLDDAKNLLGGILTSPGRRVVRPSEIIKAVSNHFNIKKEELCGRKRTREIVVPRQILVYLLREEVDMPYKQIGAEIGGRDHTTIMHDYNKIKELVIDNESLDEEITQIKNKLYAVD